MNMGKTKESTNETISLRKSKLEYYRKESEKLREWFCLVSLNLDKLIFGLSSGAIILSVTFIKTIVSSANIEQVFLLKFSWLLLAIALITNLATHYFVIKGTKKSRSKLDAWFKSNEFKVPDLSTMFDSKVDKLNLISLTALIVGILLLSYFASLNINTIAMDDKNKKINEEETTEKFSESAFDNELTEQEMNIEPEDKPDKEEKE